MTAPKGVATKLAVRLFSLGQARAQNTPECLAMATGLEKGNQTLILWPILGTILAPLNPERRCLAPQNPLI
jgi:hypothetical protein